MILEHQRLLCRLRAVLREFAVHGAAGEFLPVMQKNSVQEHRQVRQLHEFRSLEAWRLEHDVVGLPFAGLSRGIRQRRPLTVNRAGLTVRVREVLIRIEHLNLIEPLKEYAAITAILTVAANLLW